MPKTKPALDVAAAMASLMKGTAAERRWDKLLGGDETRAYRDIALWGVQRLVAGGAALADVLKYLHENAELEA